MKKKIIALFVSFLTVGASATLFAAPACCAAPSKEGTEAANGSATPAGMMLASYEKVSNALAADDLAAAQTAARTFAAVADITGTDMGCPVSEKKKDCDAEKKACGDSEKACGDKDRKECGDGAKNCTKSLQALIEAENLEEAREHFKMVSAQAIQLAANEDGYFVINCGMAGENANWLQSDQEVRNPYHGSSMLRCGVVKPLENAASTGAQ